VLGRYSLPCSQTSFRPGTATVDADFVGVGVGAGVGISRGTVTSGAGAAMAWGTVIVSGVGIFGEDEGAITRAVAAGLAQLPVISSTQRDRRLIARVIFILPPPTAIIINPRTIVMQKRTSCLPGVVGRLLRGGHGY
jgi:hypothetical protein